MSKVTEYTDKTVKGFVEITDELLEGRLYAGEDVASLIDLFKRMGKTLQSIYTIRRDMEHATVAIAEINMEID